MELPKATAIKADKTFADEKFYTFDDRDGLYRRLRKEHPSEVIAELIVTGLAQPHRFLEVYSHDGNHKPEKVQHAPGPKGTAA